MLRQKSRRGFLIFFFSALFLKILTKKCQRGQFLPKKITFLAFLVNIFKNKVLLKKKKKEKKKEKKKKRKEKKKKEKKKGENPS